MARQKKNGVHINYFIDKDIKDKLDNYCNEVGQTNTTAIERILVEFLDKYEKEKKEQDETDI